MAGINLIVYKAAGQQSAGRDHHWRGVVDQRCHQPLLPVVTDGLLSPLLDPLLNNLLQSLGINLMDVDVGANMTCGQTGKAYLVI